MFKNLTSLARPSLSLSNQTRNQIRNQTRSRLIHNNNPESIPKEIDACKELLERYKKRELERKQCETIDCIGNLISGGLVLGFFWWAIFSSENRPRSMNNKYDPYDY